MDDHPDQEDHSKGNREHDDDLGEGEWEKACHEGDSLGDGSEDTTRYPGLRKGRRTCQNKTKEECQQARQDE
jgi:hypothetical protein